VPLGFANEEFPGSVQVVWLCHDLTHSSKIPHIVPYVQGSAVLDANKTFTGLLNP